MLVPDCNKDRKVEVGRKGGWQSCYLDIKKGGDEHYKYLPIPKGAYLKYSPKQLGGGAEIRNDPK